MNFMYNFVVKKLTFVKFALISIFLINFNNIGFQTDLDFWVFKKMGIKSPRRVNIFAKLFYAKMCANTRLEDVSFYNY